jgi:hypothetical protein
MVGRIMSASLAPDEPATQAALGGGEAGSPTLEPSGGAAATDDRRLVEMSLDVAGDDPRLLYGTSPDGQWWAYRDSWNGPGRLHLADRAGNTIDLDFGEEGSFAPQAATFSPDGTTLAVADSDGALWTVELSTTTPKLIARGGPFDSAFGRSLRFADSDHLLVALVGSVEVPIPSRVGMVDLRNGEISVLSDDTWAYGPRSLFDGTIAYLHLGREGSYLAVREAGNDVAEIADVGFIDGGFDISGIGLVAYSDGHTTWIVDKPGGKARVIGSGTEPRFSSDGLALLIFDARTGTSRLLGTDGSEIATADSPFVRISTPMEGN